MLVLESIQLCCPAVTQGLNVKLGAAGGVRIWGRFRALGGGGGAVQGGGGVGAWGRRRGVQRRGEGRRGRRTASPLCFFGLLELPKYLQ